MSASVSLVPLTRLNYQHAIKICVLPEQDHWTATVEGTIADAYFDPNITMRVVQHETHGPVGFIAWSSDFDASSKRNRYDLQHIRVAYQHQGHGIAREVLAIWLKELTRPGVVTLAVNTKNERAMKLYTRVGFELGSEVRNELRRGQLVLDTVIVAPVAASTCAGDDSSWCDEHGKQSCPWGAQDDTHQ